MEVNKRNKREKAGGVRLAACRSMMVMLFVMLVFTMMPLLAPGTGQANAAVNLQWPTPGHENLSRGYGNYTYKDKNGKTVTAFHGGIDITDGSIGATYVYSAAKGKVTKVTKCGKKHYGSFGDCNGFGTGVVIKGTDGRIYHYAHMLGESIPSKVYKGATVEKGQIIGQVGTTGNSTGNHLHFAISSHGDKYYENLVNPKGSTFSYSKSKPGFNQYPFGFIGKCSTGAGTLTVRGWAYDPDNKGKTINVRVYYKKSDNTYQFIGTGPANLVNETADKKFKCGKKHAFIFTLDTTKFPKGKKEIYITGVNIDKSGKAAGSNAFLTKGSSAVTSVSFIEKKAAYKVVTGDAKNVLNTSATISGKTEPPGTVNSWGFYLGISESDMNSHKYPVALKPTSSANMSAQVANYTKLQPGRKYFYKIYANIGGKEVVASNYNTFQTTTVKPDIPQLKVDSKTEEIGIGDSPIFNWAKVNNAEYYKLYVYDEAGNEIKTVDNITGETCSIEAIQEAGTYTACIESYNSVGTKGKSEEVSFIVHPNVNVTFMDADSFADVDPETYTPEVLGTSEVAWGHDAELPAKPSHNGYTFTGWSDESKAVKEDVTVVAEYERNTYTVTFVDSKTGDTIGESQKVSYFKAANPPDFSVESGYAKLGYNGWDKDYNCITEDTTMYTCVGWYNDDFPIYATITNAVREYDVASSEDEGYTVTLRLQNWNQGTTKGRAVVALKTSEGKLLTTTESAAFSIKTSATKEIEVFVPYENAASIAEAYIIGQYKDAVPISSSVEFTIDQSNTMTSWSTEQPPVGAANIEERLEYRYRDKQTTTSYSTSLAGYTQNGGSWVKQSGGNIDYVTSFPSGFNKSSAYYTKYNGVKPKTASETATTKTTVSTSKVGYIYWHWCRGATSGPSNRLVSDCKEGSYTHWHSLSQSSPITFDSSAKSFYKKDASICKDSYWWMTTYANKSTQLPIMRCTYNNYKKLFNYYRWTDWSEWSTTPATASANKEVVTRTVYRYQQEGVMEEDTSGEPRVVSGNVDPSFAGKEATLFIYKIDEASDFTNEYVDQAIIGEDGSYSFSFKLREEPTAEMGDFTVALGIEGATAPIFLDPIEAPKKVYTVNYYDYDDKIGEDEPLYSVEVEEHGDAPLPDETALEREGYTFTKWSDTNMNVTEHRNLVAQYKVNTYTVVFVDWQARTVSMEEFEYGEPLVAPQPAEPEEGQTVEWDKIADGVQTVTEDMVVSTRYKDKELDITILDENGHTDEVQQVKYGMAVDLPEIESTTEKEFVGWEDISTEDPEGLQNSLMTTNAILCPVYVFNETVANPTADLAQGEYNSVQTVRLSCDTAGADIYYTLDGSDPRELNSNLYTGPIEIDGPVELKFYAAKFEMNDSNVQKRLYTVNYDGATSKWMLEEDLPQEVADNQAAYQVAFRQGYRYKDTRLVKTLAEAAALEAAGWTTDPEAEVTYDEFSNWSETMPSDVAEYIDVDIETEPVYTDADQFTYSHYVYEDGVTKYSPTSVDGFECEYEEIGPFEEPLYAAGKDAYGNRFYSYDGQMWYNQQETSGQIQTGTKYRWRHQTVPYTKWSDWTITKPGTGEEREYESHEVVSYARPDYHIVTVHYGEDTWSYLAKEGSLADIDSLNADGEDNSTYAYDVLGVYTDENYTNEWDLESNTITASTELFVKTEKKSFDVYFVDEDLDIEAAEEEIGTMESLSDYAISTQTVTYGESAEAPAAPNKNGYVFVGWDSDDYKAVKDDLVIRARYVPEDEYATVTLDQEAITLYKGTSADLTALISPLSKSDTELTWISSDEDVAQVSETGTVYGTGRGTAEITVKVDETGETATCAVTVNVDNTESLSLIKNDKLSIDGEGFLRGAKGNKDTVEDILAYFDNANLKCVNMEGEEVEPTDLFGTGFKIQLMAEEAIKDAVEAVVTGDFSGDGSINNKDVALLLRHLMDQVEPTPAQVRAGDVNGSGRVDARDAVLTLRVIVGKDSLD